MSRRNTAEEAARSRKILAKDKALKLSPVATTEIQLNRNYSKSLGEYAVLAMCGPFGTHQWTICRPIGITDLAANDWIMIRTDQVPATLARAEDPRKSEVDKDRAKYRNELLVKANLLELKEKGPSAKLYYPGGSVPRNDLLDSARKAMKATVKPLREQLNELPKKGSGAQKQKLNEAIRKSSDVLEYLDEPDRQAEIAIRTRIRDPAMVKAVEDTHPYEHRTLIGPFGDKKQVAIYGAQGYPLIDVLGAIEKQWASQLDLTNTLGNMPSAVGAPKPASKTMLAKVKGAVSGKSRGRSQPPAGR